MDHTALARILDARIFGKSLLSGYFRLNEQVLALLPAGSSQLRPLRAYKKFLHALVRARSQRTVYFGTFFMRNRPQLDFALRLTDRRKRQTDLKVLVVASSIGAETYSISWSFRSLRPNLKMTLTAMDISADAVTFARAGVYQIHGSEFTDEQLFARLTESEIDQLFVPYEGGLRVKDWIREEITWSVGDAGDAALAERLGAQDMVFANNFLCHLSPSRAEECLRNVVALVRPGGYLFVSGVDLDVRTTVARALGLQPVTECIREIHAGDPALANDWPLRYWGLEPFDCRRSDWHERYASVFRVPGGEW